MGRYRPSKWGTLSRKSFASGTQPDRLGSRAERTLLQGKSFVSKLEAAVWLVLKAEEATGMIQNLRTQPNVMLVGGIRMIPDFAYEKDGVQWWAEAKGHPTDVWALKLRLWKAGFGPGPLRIFKGTYRRPLEVETVWPKVSAQGCAECMGRGKE